MKNLKFVKSFAGFNENEQASFFEERAQALIAAGVAVEVELPVEEKSSKKKKAEECQTDGSQPGNAF